MKRAHRTIILLLIGMSIMAVWSATLLHPRSLSWSGWAYSEWLINYDGGFIRRGLGGWLIGLARRGGNVLETVNALVFVNYAAVLLTFFLVWWRSKARSFGAFVLAILIPGGLFQMAIGIEFFFRKEIAFHVALGLDCLLYGWFMAAATARAKVTAARVFFALFAVQCVLLPLVHESYVFISFPASFLLALDVARQLPQERGLMRLVKLSVALQVVMFALCTVFKGNPDVLNQMWHMLRPEDRLLISPAAPDRPDGGMSAIGWTALWNLGGVLHVFVSGQFWIWGFAGLGVTLVLALVTAWSVRDDAAHKGERLRRHMRQLLFLFVASAPMYVLGVDWGRWMSSVTISYLFLCLTDGDARVPAPDCLRLIPSKLRARIAAAFEMTASGFFAGVAVSTTRHRSALFLLALFFCLTFRSPECCLAMGFNPFFRLKPLVMEMLR